jgi:hypothetical protein
MLRRRSRRSSTVLTYHREWLLCHRGADRSVIAEIVNTLEANEQTVIVQEHDGLWMSLAEFGEFISDEINAGNRYLIILLNQHLTGPMFRQTFDPIRQQIGYATAFYKMRIDDCDTEGVDDLVNLADIRDPDMRQREIFSICPTDRARSCGLRAA